MGTDFLLELPGAHYVLWGSNVMDVVHRAMGTFEKSASATSTRLKITFVTPFVAPPSGNSFEEVGDLFRHRMLGDRRDAFIADRRILRQQGCYAYSGQCGPITTCKSFLCVTVSTNAHNVSPHRPFNGNLTWFILRWEKHYS